MLVLFDREEINLTFGLALKKLDIHFEFDYDAYCCDDLESCDSDCEESDCVGLCRMFKNDDKKKAKNAIYQKDEAGFTNKESLFKTGFTKVSKFLVFNLMPNLKVRIHKMMD